MEGRDGALQELADKGLGGPLEGAKPALTVRSAFFSDIFRIAFDVMRKTTYT